MIDFRSVATCYYALQNVLAFFAPIRTIHAKLMHGGCLQLAPTCVYRQRAGLGTTGGVKL